jgi:DNA-binding MarR family transcriptional regulator
MASDRSPAAFYSGDSYSDDENVVYLMKRVRASIAQAADRRLEPQGITRAQMGALCMLRRTRGSTAAAIARELQIDPGPMTRTLAGLEAKGLCRRRPSAEDGRVLSIDLTPDGQVAADRALAVLTEVMDAHLAGFSSEETLRLRNYLQRMRHNAGG